MSNAIFTIPPPINEVVLNYAPGSAERKELKKALKELKSTEWDIPMTIGGKKVRTKTQVLMHPPHELKHNLGQFHQGTAKHVNEAIDAALAANIHSMHTNACHIHVLRISMLYLGKNLLNQGLMFLH